MPVVNRPSCAGCSSLSAARRGRARRCRHPAAGPTLAHRVGVARRGLGRELVKLLAPAHVRAVCAHGTGAVRVRADGGEGAVWGLGLADMVQAPALDLAACPQAAAVEVSEADGDKLAVG